MAKSYSEYSKQRKAIMQQVNRLEKRGYKVPDKYKLPTVKELRSMSYQGRTGALGRAERYTTEDVRQSAKYVVNYTTKTGKQRHKLLSYEEGRKIEREESAHKGIETRHRKRSIGEGGVGGGDYRPPKEPSPAPEPAEPKTYTDERGNIVDLETGEVIHDASVHTAIDEEGNIYDVETGEVYGNREQYADYMQAKDEGIISEEQTFEDWLVNMADEPTGQAYVQTVSDFLELQDEEEAANLINEMAEEQNIFDPVGFNRRMANGDLPDVGDFYYTDNNGDVHFNVRAYIKLAQVIKGRKLRASELRQISKAIGHD